jgi:hypothetical protein
MLVVPSPKKQMLTWPDPRSLAAHAAPVTVGDGAYTAAGSVITNGLPVASQS